MTSIQLEVGYVPARGIAFREIEERFVIVHPGENRLLTLNETGSALWRCLDGRPLRAALDAVLKDFDVEAEALHRDVVAFLERMLAEGLIVEADQS